MPHGYRRQYGDSFDKIISYDATSLVDVIVDSTSGRSTIGALYNDKHPTTTMLTSHMNEMALSPRILVGSNLRNSMND